LFKNNQKKMKLILALIMVLVAVASATCPTQGYGEVVFSAVYRGDGGGEVSTFSQGGSLCSSSMSNLRFAASVMATSARAVAYTGPDCDTNVKSGFSKRLEDGGDASILLTPASGSPIQLIGPSDTLYAANSSGYEKKLYDDASCTTEDTTDYTSTTHMTLIGTAVALDSTTSSKNLYVSPMPYKDGGVSAISTSTTLTEKSYNVAMRSESPNHWGGGSVYNVSGSYPNLDVSVDSMDAETAVHFMSALTMGPDFDWQTFAIAFANPGGATLFPRDSLTSMFSAPTSRSPENCFNNIDDDGDEKVDCADPDCGCPASTDVVVNLSDSFDNWLGSSLSGRAIFTEKTGGTIGRTSASAINSMGTSDTVEIRALVTINNPLAQSVLVCTFKVKNSINGDWHDLWNAGGPGWGGAGSSCSIGNTPNTHFKGNNAVVSYSIPRIRVTGHMHKGALAIRIVN
jgi:hypothetical protein